MANKMSENLRLRLQCETELGRSVRLSKYSESQEKCLNSESEEQHVGRDVKLSENHRKRLKSQRT